MRNLGDELPQTGVLLAVDHGLKRLGLAASDAGQTWAMPLQTLLNPATAATQAALLKAAQDYRAVGWVVGLPLHMSGDEGPQARLAREFGCWLARESHRPVAYWDERLSSSAAEALLWSRGESSRQQKGRLDPIAAQFILQAYLDARRPAAGSIDSPPPSP